jgi:hypothetical protein
MHEHGSPMMPMPAGLVWHSGGGLLPSFARTLQLGGAQALLLRVLLSRMSGRLSEQVRPSSNSGVGHAKQCLEVSAWQWAALE